MGTFIIVGYRHHNSEPEILYCGSDGVKAAQAGVDARESGQFARLVRHVNPVGTPLPPQPFHKSVAVVTAAVPAEVNNPNTRRSKK